MKLLLASTALAALVAAPLAAQSPGGAAEGAVGAGASAAAGGAGIAAEASGGASAGARGDSGTDGTGKAAGKDRAESRSAAEREAAEGGVMDGRAFAAAGGKIETLTGERVYDAAGEWVGEVDRIIVEPDGSAWAVVDVGGFMGIGEKPVAVPFQDLRIQAGDDARLKVSTALTLEELEAMPDYNG